MLTHTRKKAAAHPPSPSILISYTSSMQVTKAKLAEAQDAMATSEKAITYVAVGYGEASLITELLIQQSKDTSSMVEVAKAKLVPYPSSIYPGTDQIQAIFILTRPESSNL
ncbi:hypothetical protein EMCRGX_G005194 [Ephydatia muelleri]